MSTGFTSKQVLPGAATFATVRLAFLLCLVYSTDVPSTPHKLVGPAKLTPNSVRKGCPFSLCSCACPVLYDGIQLGDVVGDRLLSIQTNYGAAQLTNIQDGSLLTEISNITYVPLIFRIHMEVPVRQLASLTSNLQATQTSTMLSVLVWV